MILHELHSHPDILRHDPVQEPAFQPWSKDFSAETHTDEIASLLERYPELRSQMDTLVPEHVSYSDFWKRYLYQKSKIDADEARRKQMIESKDEDHEFDWDGDDDADDLELEGKASTETVKQVTVKTRVEENPRNSSTSESSTSFDIVSQSSAVPPLTKEKEDKVCPPSRRLVDSRARRLRKRVMMIGNSLRFGVIRFRMYYGWACIAFNWRRLDCSVPLTLSCPCVL